MTREATGFEGVPPSVVAAWKDDDIAGPATLGLRDPGPDYLSVDQLRVIWDVSHTTARRRVKDLVRLKRVTVKVRDAARANGSRYPLPVYRLKTPPETV